MTNDQSPKKEIYIVIDPHHVRHNSLEIAVLLAERLKANISARLIRNDLLDQVASLPFTTEVLLSSGEERSFGAHTIDESESRNVFLVTQLLEQRAQMRKISFRIETITESSSLKNGLAKQENIFLPALKKSFRAEGKGRSVSSIQDVKWVYDNCAASERCFGLLKELAEAGITRNIYIYGNKAVPSSIPAALSESGARVYWINVAGEAALSQQLQSGREVDLILLPASFSSAMGEDRLQELNKQCDAPILVVA